MTESKLEPGKWRASHKPVETTLGEWGWQTTIGTADKGHLALQLYPPGLPLLRRIGLEVETDPTIASQVGRRMWRSLACATRRIGDVDLTSKSLEEKVAIVGGLRMTDLQYMSILHLAAHDGGKFTLPFGVLCPQCKRRTPPKVEVDLKTLALNTYSVPLEVHHRFRRKFRLMARDVEEITLSPPPISRAFGGLSTIDLNTETLREQHWVAAAVTQINGTPAVVTAEQLAGGDDDLNGMATDDWRGLVDAMNHTGGVATQVGWEHGCGAKLAVHVPWVSAFFSDSQD